MGASESKMIAEKPSNPNRLLPIPYSLPEIGNTLPSIAEEWHNWGMDDLLQYARYIIKNNTHQSSIAIMYLSETSGSVLHIVKESYGALDSAGTDDAQLRLQFGRTRFDHLIRGINSSSKRSSSRSHSSSRNRHVMDQASELPQNTHISRRSLRNTPEMSSLSLVDESDDGSDDIRSPGSSHSVRSLRSRRSRFIDRNDLDDGGETASLSGVSIKSKHSEHHGSASEKAGSKSSSGKRRQQMKSDLELNKDLLSNDYEGRDDDVPTSSRNLDGMSRKPGSNLKGRRGLSDSLDDVDPGIVSGRSRESKSTKSDSLISSNKSVGSDNVSSSVRDGADHSLGVLIPQRRLIPRGGSQRSTILDGYESTGTFYSVHSSDSDVSTSAASSYSGSSGRRHHPRASDWRRRMGWPKSSQTVGSSQFIRDRNSDLRDHPSRPAYSHKSALRSPSGNPFSASSASLSRLGARSGATGSTDSNSDKDFNLKEDIDVENDISKHSRPRRRERRRKHRKQSRRNPFVADGDGTSKERKDDDRIKDMVNGEVDDEGDRSLSNSDSSSGYSDFRRWRQQSKNRRRPHSSELGNPDISDNISSPLIKSTNADSNGSYGVESNGETGVNNYGIPSPPQRGNIEAVKYPTAYNQVSRASDPSSSSSNSQAFGSTGSNLHANANEHPSLRSTPSGFFGGFRSGATPLSSPAGPSMNGNGSALSHVKDSATAGSSSRGNSISGNNGVNGNVGGNNTLPAFDSSTAMKGPLSGVLQHLQEVASRAVEAAESRVEEAREAEANLWAERLSERAQENAELQERLEKAEAALALLESSNGSLTAELLTEREKLKESTRAEKAAIHLADDLNETVRRLEAELAAERERERERDRRVREAETQARESVQAQEALRAQLLQQESDSAAAAAVTAAATAAAAARARQDRERAENLLQQRIRELEELNEAAVSSNASREREFDAQMSLLKEAKKRSDDSLRVCRTSVQELEALQAETRAELAAAAAAKLELQKRLEALDLVVADQKARIDAASVRERALDSQWTARLAARENELLTAAAAASKAKEEEFLKKETTIRMEFKAEIELIESTFAVRIREKDDEVARVRENLEAVTIAFKSECEKVKNMESLLRNQEQEVTVARRTTLFQTSSTVTESTDSDVKKKNKK